MRVCHHALHTSVLRHVCLSSVLSSCPIAEGTGTPGEEMLWWLTETCTVALEGPGRHWVLERQTVRAAVITHTHTHTHNRSLRPHHQEDAALWRKAVWLTAIGPPFHQFLRHLAVALYEQQVPTHAQT